MKKLILTISFLSALIVVSVDVNAQKKPTSQKMQKGFIEHFDKPTSKFFYQLERSDRTSTQIRYIPGAASLCEQDSEVMIFRMDPNDPVGASRGPEIISNKYTSYGSYSTRIRIPDVTKVQPNVGAVVGYFTYAWEDKSLSEIDVEWLIADPEIIYIGTWTGPSDKLQRIGRIINLAEGTIYETTYRIRGEDKIYPLTGLQNQPETIPAIEGFNAAKQFYTYGFDWYPDRIVWWILHPETEQRIILWDYKGSTPLFSGIPEHKTRYRMNFWHTNNWPVHTNPNSIEKPKYSYEVEIDWMSYEPFDVE